MGRIQWGGVLEICKDDKDRIFQVLQPFDYIKTPIIL